MVTTESGLQYKDIKVGGGPSPPVGFQVFFLWLSMTYILKIVYIYDITLNMDYLSPMAFH